MSEVLFKDECYKLVGAAIEVHRELGNGFLEPVYQEAFERELSEQGVPFAAQPSLRIYYKGQPLLKEYFADLIAYGTIILELKVLPKLTSREEAQILNYLRASKLRLGLLINFGSPAPLEWKRIVN